MIPGAEGAIAMTKDARHGRIVAALEQNGQIEVTQLAAEFDVSEMTIRRDLEELEHRGLCRRVHGGAVTAGIRGYEPPFEVRREQNLDAKMRIGQRAAELIASGETVLLDIGTTTLQVAHALRPRYNVSVITPSLDIAILLADEPGIRSICLGGHVRRGEHSTVGSLAERSLHDFHVDVCILSAGGVSVAGGITEYHSEGAQMKRAMIDRAQRLVVVADESKLGAVTFAVVAPISVVDTLVTSARESNEHLLATRNAGVHVINV